MTSPFLHAQQLEAPYSGAKHLAISGGVFQPDGLPVSGAKVLLLTADGSRIQTITAADGQFVFHDVLQGRCTLSAEKQGRRSSAFTTLSSESSPPYTRITLSVGADPESIAGDQGINFSDTSDFIVSGVTDWTAVGGHGSDATLRTSEDLARATSALRNKNAHPAAAHDAEENHLREAFAAASHDLSPNLALGKYLARAGAYQQALPFLRTASAVSNQGHEAEYYLALVCYRLDDTTEATMHIQHALAQTDAAAYHALAGAIAESQGDAYAAVQHMQHAARLEASEENYFAWASELLLHRAVLQAAEIFVRGANAFPSSARMQTGWGSALFAEGQYDEAAQRLCKAADLQPDEAAPYLLLGKVEEASPTSLPCVQERLARFVKLVPGNADASYFYAMSLLRRRAENASKSAETLLQEAVRLNPSHAAALLQLGIFAVTRQQYPQAMDLYKRAIAADPTQVEAHYRLAVAYDRVGLSAEAAAERSLHESMKLRNADLVEQERRKLKQFLVTLQPSSPPK